MLLNAFPTKIEMNKPHAEGNATPDFSKRGDKWAVSQ